MHCLSRAGAIMRGSELIAFRMTQPVFPGALY